MPVSIVKFKETVLLLMFIGAISKTLGMMTDSTTFFTSSSLT